MRLRKPKKEWRHRKQRRVRITAMIRKELDWIVHDKISMFILFFLPIFLIISVGNVEFNIDSRAQDTVVYVIDLDSSEYSLDYIETIRGENFTFTVYDNHENPDLVTMENAEALIPTTELGAYLIIPSNFSETLLENQTAKIDLYIDGINTIEMLVIKYQFISANLLYQVEYQVFNSEVLYIPEYRPEIDRSILENAVPNMIPTILYAVSNMVACQAIVADDPLKRMLLSPTRKGEVIQAKTFAYIFFGALLSLVCMCVLTFGFGIYFISPLDTFLIFWMTTIFGVTFGLFFSSLASSRLQGAQLFLFSFIFQQMLVNNLRIEPIVNYMPIEVIRQNITDIVYRGIPFLSLGNQIALIAGMNLVALGAAWLSLSLKKEVA
ncbi:MAG: hypothetical protein GF364_10615 [Candidatus Lokiarchaeota archaeon]|nr:hypothetical protein [Candidatus Lokiarchaeota archaeon]